MAAPEESPAAVELNYHSEGPVPGSIRDDGVAMVEKLASMSPRPIIFARVKVTVDQDRNPDEDSIVQGTIDISGKVIRAQAAADTPFQALRILEKRLQRRLNRLAERREQRSERPPSADSGPSRMSNSGTPTTASRRPGTGWTWSVARRRRLTRGSGGRRRPPRPRWPTSTCPHWTGS